MNANAPPQPMGSLADERRLWWLVLGFTLLRVILAAILPLSPQEAYYWTWSRDLAWSYFDHPPLASYSIRLTTAVFGQTVFGIKLSAVLWSLALNLVWLRLILDMFSDRRLAFWALLLGFLGLDAARTSTAVGALIPRRATAAFLVAMAALSTVQWGATIAGAAVTGTLPADVASHGWATSPLYAIELAFAVPLLAIGGIGLWRHQPRGALLAVPLIVFLALLGLGLAWEPVFVALEGGSFDVATAMAGILFFALPGVLLAAILVRLHRAHAAS